MAGRGRPKNPPKPKKLLKEVLPFEEIFTEDELPMYKELVDLYMADFDQDDLSSSDIDDIMDLAKNRILEFRLLKGTRDSLDGDRLVDISAALEKIKKENKILKENLSTRRKDRINPNEFKGFSIVDLAVAFDTQKKERLAEQIRHNREEEVEIISARGDYLGNRYDSDAKHLGHEDDET